MMRAFIFTIFSVLSSLTLLADTPAPAPAKPELKEVLKKVQANFDEIKTFSAKFSQTFRNKKTREEYASEGSVKFKKPGLMRWDYSKPTVKSFIVDGKSLWVYQPADKLVLTDHCFKQDTLTASLSFLWGDANIEKQFDASYFSEQLSSDASDLNILLVPKVASPYYKRLILVVDAKKYQVKQSIVIDLANNSNQFQFSDVLLNEKDDKKKNLKLQDSDFQFKKSKDTHESPIPGSDEKCKKKE